MACYLKDSQKRKVGKEPNMFGMWELIYFGCFLFGFGYLLIVAFAGQIGGDAEAELDTDFEADFDADLDGDVDAGGHDVDHSHDAGHEFSIFTPLVIASLLTGVGGSGLFATLTLNLPWFLHILVASLGGWAVAYMIWALFAKVLYPMQGSSEVRVGELWGTVGELTTSIPEGRVGEVRFIAGGSYVSHPARSASGDMLPRGQMVIIEKVENSVAIVRPTE